MSTSQNDYRVVWGPQRFYLSLGWKTLIAFALVVFLPMGGLLLISGQTLRDALEEETFHALEANIRGAWDAYERPMNDVRIALVQTAGDERTANALRVRDAAALFRILERQQRRFEYVDVWFALAPDETVVGRIRGPLDQHYNLGPGLGRALGTQRETLITTELLAREVFTSEDPERYAALPPLVMAQVIVAPVRDLGALVGVLLLQDNQLLMQQLQNQLTIERTYAALVQGNRAVATARLPNAPFESGSEVDGTLDRALKGGQVYTGVLPRGLDHRDLVLAEPILNGDFQPIGGLVLASGDERITTHLQQGALHVYGFIALGLALSLLIALLAYRDTIRPLRAIIRAQNDFAEGDHGVRAEIVTRDEFEALGSGFNRLADAVSAQEQRLTQYAALSSLVNLSMSAEELLQSTLDKVVEITRATVGMIHLIESGSNRLLPFAAHALDLEALEPLKIGEGVPGQVALERKTRRVTELGDAGRVSLQLGVGTIAPGELAYFPLLYRGELLGLLTLGFHRPRPAEEFVLLEHLARQVAIILNDASAQRRIRELATRDPLTGTATRAHFTSEIGRHFNEAQRFGTDLSLLMIDIDHFHQFTDRFGYHMADAILTTVAGVLTKSVRKTDVIARFGDNRFAVAMPQTDTEQATVAAEKVRKNLIGTSVNQLDRERITISIGIASYPDPEVQSPVELVRRADQALGRAKQGGRNRVEAA